MHRQGGRGGGAGETIKRRRERQRKQHSERQPSPIPKAYRSLLQFATESDFQPHSLLLTGMAGDHGLVHVVDSKTTWDLKVAESKNTHKIIVVDFTATWCGPCRIMSPIFIELSKKYPGLIFLKVDVDEVPDVTSTWEIRAMPTFLFIKEGKQIDKIVGANKDELDRKVQHYASQSKS
ncbi:hypothetical protein BDL97_10G063600 [Sphagnum fallax]|nr:hypothetical protein BDL97_10G063600 [Sphagnum fallax]